MSMKVGASRRPVLRGRMPRAQRPLESAKPMWSAAGWRRSRGRRNREDGTVWQIENASRLNRLRQHALSCAAAQSARAAKAAALEIASRAVDICRLSVVKKRVLFLCTGNAARSQMAEGLANAFHGDVMEAVSAGSRPAGWVH